MTHGNVARRFLDAAEESTKTLTPLEGYEKQDLVSLEEAVKYIEVPIHNLNAMVWTAKRNSSNLSDGLTSDESAAIGLYTLEWPDGYDNFYTLLNHRLRSDERKCLKSWFSYLKLLLTALFKLPSIKKTIWRGIRGRINNLNNNDIIWWGISSCTTTIEVMERFIGPSGERTLFMIECINGKVIKSHSSYQDENEIILMPGTYLTVIGKWSPSENLHIIHLQEENPPYELLKPPFDLSSLSVKMSPSDQLKISQSTLSESQATPAPPHKIKKVSTNLSRTTIRRTIEPGIRQVDHTGKDEALMRGQRDHRKQDLMQYNNPFASVLDRVKYLEQTNKQLQNTTKISTSKTHIKQRSEYIPQPTPPKPVSIIPDTKNTHDAMLTKMSFQRSARGPIQIDECSPDGKYIQLANTSKNKDIDLTGWRLLRKADNSPEKTYSFPSGFKLAAGKNVRIHVRGQGKEESSHDLVSPTHGPWEVGYSVNTHLLNEQNEEIAIYTQKTISAS